MSIMYFSIQYIEICACVFNMVPCTVEEGVVLKVILVIRRSVVLMKISIILFLQDRRDA